MRSSGRMPLGGDIVLRVRDIAFSPANRARADRPRPLTRVCILRSMDAGSPQCVRVSAVRSATTTGPSARRSLPLVLLMLWMTACSTARPVLYPNAHLQSVGQAVADRDINECEQKAETAGVTRQEEGVGNVAAGTAVGAGVGAAGGAVGGAISGGAGIGAAIGAASGAVVGLLSSLFGRRHGPSATYVNFVDRCLREKGYEPIGWQKARAQGRV